MIIQLEWVLSGHWNCNGEEELLIRRSSYTTLSQRCIIYSLYPCKHNSMKHGSTKNSLVPNWYLQNVNHNYGFSIQDIVSDFDLFIEFAIHISVTRSFFWGMKWQNEKKSLISSQPPYFSTKINNGQDFSFQMNLVPAAAYRICASQVNQYFMLIFFIHDHIPQWLV